jgi:hypothetical protein
VSRTTCSMDCARRSWSSGPRSPSGSRRSTRPRRRWSECGPCSACRPGALRGPRDGGALRPPTPAEPASAGVPPSTGQQSASRVCAECGEDFTPARHGGQAQKFCSKTCRQRAHKRRQPRETNGAAAGSGRGPVLEPVPDEVERPFFVPVETNIGEEEAGQREVALRPPRHKIQPPGILSRRQGRDWPHTTSGPPLRPRLR